MAIECYENGILTEENTGGIELKWGNAGATVQATQQMVGQKHDFGKLLAMGSAGAAKILGKGFKYMVTFKSFEFPMHGPRISPGFVRTYCVYPTPGRHFKGGAETHARCIRLDVWG